MDAARNSLMFHSQVLMAKVLHDESRLGRGLFGNPHLNFYSFLNQNSDESQQIKDVNSSISKNLPLGTLDNIRATCSFDI